MHYTVFFSSSLQIRNPVHNFQQKRRSYNRYVGSILCFITRFKIMFESTLRKLPVPGQSCEGGLLTANKPIYAEWITILMLLKLGHSTHTTKSWFLSGFIVGSGLNILVVVWFSHIGMKFYEILKIRSENSYNIHKTLVYSIFSTMKYEQSISGCKWCRGLTEFSCLQNAAE